MWTDERLRELYKPVVSGKFSDRRHPENMARASLAMRNLGEGERFENSIHLLAIEHSLADRITGVRFVHRSSGWRFTVSFRRTHGKRKHRDLRVWRLTPAHHQVGDGVVQRFVADQIPPLFPQPG